MFYLEYGRLRRAVGGEGSLAPRSFSARAAPGTFQGVKLFRCDPYYEGVMLSKAITSRGKDSGTRYIPFYRVRKRPCVVDFLL